MMNQNKKSEVRSRKQEARRKKPEKTESSLSSLLHLASCILLFALLIGCGISKDVYQKTAEESEARKASLEQAQKEIEQLKQESQQLKTRTGDLSKQIEELVAGNEAAFSQMKQKLDAQAEEMNALKKEKEELVTKAEYLNREVERLKLKSGELSTEKEKEVAHLKETYETLMKEMKEEIDKGEIKITQAVDRLSVNMVEKILFDSGKAEVKPGGLKILNRVGTILKGVTDKQIRIEGHTDNVKIGTRIKEKYPTNWELSTARATNVVRYLQDNIGIDPKLLFAAGYSEYRSVASNETIEGRAQNRRMEIVLLPLDLSSVVEELKKK